MRWLTIGLLLVLCACGSTATSAQSAASGSPAASASSAASASTPSPPTGPRCRLPFLRETASPFGPGFVSSPDGTFTLDPSGALHGLPDGTGMETYDWAFSRWVPSTYS